MVFSGRWTGAVAELLEPLYDVLRQYVLMPGKVYADDILVPACTIRRHSEHLFGDMVDTYN